MSDSAIQIILIDSKLFKSLKLCWAHKILSIDISRLHFWVTSQFSNVMQNYMYHAKFCLEKPSSFLTL